MDKKYIFLIISLLTLGIIIQGFKPNENFCYNKQNIKGGYKELFENYRMKRKVVIALIDSGFCCLKNIPKENVWYNANEINTNGIDDDRNGYIDDLIGWNCVDGNNDIGGTDLKSHGTFLASYLAGSSYQNQGLIANMSCCEIMFIKALPDGEDEKGTVNSLINAVQYAESNGADICNLSLSTYQDSAELKDVITKSKMLFVVAAGNEGENLNNGYPSYPSRYNLSNVVSVAAINNNGELLEESNYGNSYVDVAAYGDNIQIWFGDGRYELVSGTSIATPYVTAVAALIYSYSEDELSAVEIKNRIVSVVEKKEELSVKIKSKGYLDINQVLEREIIKKD